MRKIERLKSALKSKDGKVLASNFAYLSLLQVAGYVFPLITLPYLARVIGVDGFGKIAFASAVIVWIQTIADWGFNFTATRDVARNRDNIAVVSQIFSNVLWARLLLMVVSLAILLVLIAFVPDFKENADVILVTFLLVPGHILFPEWFFQAMERMRYITVLNLLSKLVFTVAVFLCVKTKDDYVLQPLLVSLGYLVAGIIAMYYIILKWRVRLHSVSIKTVLLTIKTSSDVFINNLMPNLYNSFSTMLLGFFGGSVANGLLDAGTRFVNITQQFMGVVSRTFYPFLSRRIEKHSLYAKLNITCAIVCSLLLFVLAPYIIRLFFTIDFEQSIVVLQILSVSIIFLSLNNVYGTNYMILEGRERDLRNITAICSIVGFIASFPLIYYWGYIGAAITVTLTRGLLGIGIAVCAKSIQNKKL